MSVKWDDDEYPDEYSVPPFLGTSPYYAPWVPPE